MSFGFDLFFLCFIQISMLLTHCLKTLLHVFFGHYTLPNHYQWSSSWGINNSVLHIFHFFMCLGPATGTGLYLTLKLLYFFLLFNNSSFLLFYFISFFSLFSALAFSLCFFLPIFFIMHFFLVPSIQTFLHLYSVWTISYLHTHMYVCFNIYQANVATITTTIQQQY